MNTKTFFTAASAVAAVAVTLFSGVAAASGEATYEYPSAITSSVTRAQVQADYVKARAAGLIVQGERSIVVAETGPSLSRAQVKAELQEAIRVGAIDRHEQSVVPTAAQLESIRVAGQRAAAMVMAAL